MILQVGEFVQPVVEGRIGNRNSLSKGFIRGQISGSMIQMKGEGDNSDPDADTFTLSPSFHQQSENKEAQDKAQIEVNSSKELKYIEICTDSKGSFHGSGGTHSMPDNCSVTGLCLCESGIGENEIVSRTSMQQLPNESHFVHKSQIQHARKVNKSCERVKTNR